MKKIFALATLLVAALALTNCSKEEIVTPEVEGKNFELFASMGNTRTTMDNLVTSWANGDAMNVWTAATEGFTSHDKFTVSDVANGKFEGTLNEAFDNTTANDWYAIYPYSTYGLLPVNSSTEGTWMYVGHGTPKQTGNNSQAHLNGSSAPLYGVAKAVAGTDTPVFQMHHLATFVRIRVTNNTSNPFTVGSVYVTTENELTLTGSYYLNITGEEVVYTPSQTKTEVTLTVLDGEAIAVGEQAEFYLPLAPIQFGATDEMVTVDITTTDGATISVEKTIPANTYFAAGVMNTLKVEATDDNTVLPETDSWTLITSAAQLIEGEYAVMVNYAGSKVGYLPNVTATTGPKFNAISGFDLTTEFVNAPALDDMVWTLSNVSGNLWTLTNANGNYLYNTATNNGNRVGASTTGTEWEVSAHPNNDAALMFKNTTTNRYLGVYNGQDWRSYTSYNATNYGTDAVNSQIRLYYKGTLAEKTELATPVITVTVQNLKEVVVSWEAVANAGSYEVTCGEASAIVTDGTSYTFTETNYGTTYEVSVTAMPSDVNLYKASTATTTVTTEVPATVAYYKPVTSTEALTEGKYLIVYKDKSIAVDGSQEATKSKMGGQNVSVAVTISDEGIISEGATDAAAFTIAPVTGGYTLVNKNGQYVNGPTNANDIQAGTVAANNYICGISFNEDGSATIANYDATTQLVYNTSGYFRFYKNSTAAGSNYKALHLYKLSE